MGWAGDVPAGLGYLRTVEAFQSVRAAGCEELRAAVEAMELKPGDAAELCRLDHASQREVLALGLRAARLTAREIRSMRGANPAGKELARTRGELRQVEAAVVKWWRAFRPVGWDATAHAAQPTVNAQRPQDAALATLAAEIETRATTDDGADAPRTSARTNEGARA